jgi:hypothetical protein
MNTLSLNTQANAAQAAVKPGLQWKKVVRRTAIIVVAAPLVIVPAAVMAVVAVVTGPPIAVNVNGTVGTGVDAVDLNGQMTVATRIIPDPDFNSPTNLELIIDFSSVKGNGKAKGQEKFATEAQVVIHRPLLALDPVEVTFPYFAGNGANSAKTAKAKLMVAFNAQTGISITSTVTDVPPPP